MRLVNEGALDDAGVEALAGRLGIGARHLLRLFKKHLGATPSQVERVLMGCVLSAGVGQAPARQATIKAGLPVTTPTVTVNKVCGSGLKAVMLAGQAIRRLSPDIPQRRFDFPARDSLSPLCRTVRFFRPPHCQLME